MQQWIDALKAPLATAFPNAGTVDEITRLCPAKDIADDTLKLLVRDSSGRSLAVVICSSSAVPGQVAKAMQRARDARSALGTELGRHVLEPLFEGEFQGLSYAVLPHCDALSNSRIGWHLQRRRLRPTLLGWLRATASETLAQPDETLVQRDFVEPLRRLGRLDGWPGALRETALNAAARAAEEHWSPRYVLIHNDFWRGNVLLDSTRSGPWPERFVVIDWGGSRVRGHAIFDLIRMADCLKLGDRVLRGEVEAHCRILECELIDARSHLFSALGHLAMNLDRFPLPRFLEMAQQCVQRLDSAIPESAS